MQDKEIKKKAIETLIDTSESIDIPIMPRNFIHMILQKVGLRKKVLTYNLRKMRVGNRDRISKHLFDFPDEIMDGTPMLKKVFQLTNDHHKGMIYCVAVALQNDRHEPKNELLDALNWIDEELFHYILDKSLSSIDFENFLKSIVLLTGASALMKAENQ